MLVNVGVDGLGWFEIEMKILEDHGRSITPKVREVIRGHGCFLDAGQISVSTNRST